jgi:type VI secretion system secreted protein VgrG
MRPKRDEQREDRRREGNQTIEMTREINPPRSRRVTEHLGGYGKPSTTIKMGNQTNKIDLGKIETEAMQSIELKVGQSSIKIYQMGVTIKVMMIKVEAQIQGEFKATMTQVSGSAMTMVKGGVVMIN